MYMRMYVVYTVYINVCILCMRMYVYAYMCCIECIFLLHQSCIWLYNLAWCMAGVV